MKKIFLFVLLLLIPIGVDASNRIYDIDIDVNLNKDGSANITEVWDVDGDNGTEWYKVMNNLGNMELSNFTVSMDGRKLQYKNWDVDESLSEKRGYYGINYTSDGMELCFGKYDYSRHRFTLNYTLSNFIINTNDSQIVTYKFIDGLSDVEFDNFSVDITSYYSFPDTLDVWGYGYKGYAYVSNGKISMSNEENSNMNDKYVVLLAKFPLNTFDTVNSVDGYTDFDTVYDMAEEDSFDYDYENKRNFIESIIYFILEVLPFLIFGFVGFIGVKSVIENGYGYANNRKIDKKEVPMFRDIPCNKDIYYANTLIKLNNFDYKEGNILGAIILKWVRNNKIMFKNESKGIFNKETSVIDLTMNPVFDNELEDKLFKMMYEASRDGYLETKEFEKWCRNNYSEFLSLFKRIENDNITNLKSSGMIYQRTSKEECKCKNVMNDKIYNDSLELYGLKKYLLEFSSMGTKEVMEVKLWDEYLMFAYLFGIADKVAKQLKDMYPEILEQTDMNGNVMFDYDMFMFVNHISMRSVSAASSARAAAESYSSGGGGFSSGGGGGGSFGGGGGGSR